MVRRQRKSQKLHAASLLVKKEEEAQHEGQLMPADVSGREFTPLCPLPCSFVLIFILLHSFCTANMSEHFVESRKVRHALSDVKIKLEIDDDHSKPNLDGE
jgi:hypothetical protein